MPTIAEIRKQYPQYNDLSDTEFADGLHSKFYSDMDKNDFYAKVGLPKQRTFKDKALSFVTMGHVGGEYGPETEVSFTPQGEMPEGGPRTALRILKEFDKNIREKPINLGNTYTNAFVRAATGGR